MLLTSPEAAVHQQVLEEFKLICDAWKRVSLNFELIQLKMSKSGCETCLSDERLEQFELKEACKE